MNTIVIIRDRLLPALLAVALFAPAAACVAGADDSEIASEADDVSQRPHFELWQDDRGQYFFHLNASNFETLITSEAYSTRTAALGGMLSVLDNGGLKASYELRTATSGKKYFVLLAANRQVVGTSEQYSSLTKAKAGITASTVAVAGVLERQATQTGQRFDIFAGADGRFYFNLRAKNGAIVLQSQGYDGEASAWNGAFAVQASGVAKSAYVIKPASGGGYYLLLKAANGETVAFSEVYSTKSNATRARDAIVALLPTVSLL